MAKSNPTELEYYRLLAKMEEDAGREANAAWITMIADKEEEEMNDGAE